MYATCIHSDAFCFPHLEGAEEAAEEEERERWLQVQQPLPLQLRCDGGERSLLEVAREQVAIAKDQRAVATAQCVGHGALRMWHGFSMSNMRLDLERKA